jgi:hypothetical protein
LAGISNAAFNSEAVSTFVLNSAGAIVPGGALPSPIAGSFSMWYGQPGAGNFLGSGSNGGSAISPPFTIPDADGVVLRFKTWWEIEAVNPSRFDIMQVQLLNSTGGLIRVLGQLNPAADPTEPADRVRLPYTSGGFNTAPTWQDVSLDLSENRGQVVRLGFVFTTGDDNYNNFRGWLVDEVAIRTQPPVGVQLTYARLSTATTGAKVVLTPANQIAFPARSRQP